MIGTRLLVKSVDKGWKSLSKTMKAIAQSDSKVHVGILGGKRNSRKGEPLTNVELGFVHEFGTARVPERSFIRSTFEVNREKYAGILKRLVPQIYAQKMTVAQVLNILGATMAADIKKRMADGEIKPPNAPATLERKRAKSYRGAAKGEPKALIDTAQLLGSVTWALHMKGTEKEGHK